MGIANMGCGASSQPSANEPGTVVGVQTGIKEDVNGDGILDDVTQGAVDNDGDGKADVIIKNVDEGKAGDAPPAPAPAAPAPPPAARSELHPGDEMRPGEQLTAGDYKFVVQGDGNLVVYKGSDAIWASDTNGRKIDKFVMQADGNLVSYDGSAPVWASDTCGKPVSRFTMVIHPSGPLTAMAANEERLARVRSSSPSNKI